MKTNNKQNMLIGGFVLAMVMMAMPLILAEENASGSSNDTDERILILSPNTTGSLNSNITIIELNDDLNESVSGFDIGMAKMGLWFTFNQEKKAEKELKLARLELVRARKFAKNNDTEAMEKALEAHNALIAKIQKRVDSIESDSTREGVRDSAEKLVGLERAIEVHDAKIQRLRELIESDSNLSEAQVAIIEDRIAKAENSTEHLREVQEAKKENMKTKLMAVGNMTEEEADDEILEIEDSKNLSQVKKVVREQRNSRIEKRSEIENFTKSGGLREGRGKDRKESDSNLTEVLSTDSEDD